MMNNLKNIMEVTVFQTGNDVADKTPTSKVCYGLSTALNGMKRKIMFSAFLSLFPANFIYAGDDDEPNLYMVIANVIFDEFRFPLIGFANISMNNQKLPQIGFMNYNDGNFKSLQTGFTNNVKGNMTGAQIGFANITMRRFSGVQFGFFNYIDTLENGVPAGVVSFVKNGGYHALELSTTGTSHVSFSFKTGIEKFYTSLTASYDEDSPAYSALGFGIGSKISVYDKFFVNPELNYMSKVWGGKRQYFNGDVLFGYNLSKHWSVVLGPEFTLQIADNETKRPVYKIYEREIDRKKSFIIDGKLGLRFEF